MSFRTFVLCAAMGVPSIVLPQLLSKELPADTIATVGTQVIRASDFLERYELMPWPHKDRKALAEYNKQEFLYSLIAEKLLSFEASSQNVGQDTTSQMMKYGMERMFVRDELYKREVFPKINISLPDIQNGIDKYEWEMYLEVLRILSKEEGELLYKKVVSSRNADSTLAFFNDSLFVPLDTITVDFGGNDFPLERAAYAIGEKRISHPFQSEKYGLVMLRLLNKYTNPKYANASRPDQITAVERILRGRQEDSLAEHFTSTLLQPQRAEADPAIFKIIADSVYAMFVQDSVGHKSKGLYVFSSTDIFRLIDKLQPYNNTPFITTKSGTMTVREVLEMLQYNRVVFPSLRKGTVQAILNNNIKTVVQNELIARDGFSKNIQQSEQVRHDINVWMDNRRSHLLMQQIVDTVQVSDREILDYYRRNAELFGAKVDVNIREILVDSVKLAQELRKRIDKGEDMAELARKYSKRKEWAARGGESGFFSITEHGDLGYYASSADTGEIIGPLRIKEGLTIFRMLEKRQHLDSLKQDFNQVKKTVAAKLLSEKRKQVLNKFIGGLARKYGVAVYDRNLHGVKTTTTSMFTWRHIGWGGVIVAVPSVSPQTEWIQEWLKPKDINP